MQKLVTVTIDTEHLQETAQGPFSVTEIDAVNDLLEEGWSISEWEFLTAETEKAKPVLLLMLNDGMDDMQFEESIFGLEEEQDEEDGSDDEHTGDEENDEDNEEEVTGNEAEEQGMEKMTAA